MRFLIGFLGGAVAGIIIIAVSYAVGGHSTGRAFAAIAGLAVEQGSPATGVVIFLVVTAVLGAAFTSGMCGRIATGPAILVGIVYGIFVWAFVSLLVPTVTDPSLFPIRSRAIAGTSTVFGVLMGVWVIVAAHIWPSMAGRCGQPLEGTEDAVEEE